MGQCWALVQFCLAHLIRELKFLAEHPNVMVQAYGQDLLRAVRGLFALIHQREELCPTPFQKQLEKQRRAMVRVATQTEYLSPIQRVRRSPPEYHGKVDSMPQYPVVPFNFGRPTVHDNGANVTLLDGHVERVGFKKRWEVEASKKVVHSFCYLED